MDSYVPNRPEEQEDPETIRIIAERMKTYEQDKADTVDARESVERMLRERQRKRMPQPR